MISRSTPPITLTAGMIEAAAIGALCVETLLAQTAGVGVAIQLPDVVLGCSLPFLAVVTLPFIARWIVARLDCRRSVGDIRPGRQHLLRGRIRARDFRASLEVAVVGVILSGRLVQRQ